MITKEQLIELGFQSDGLDEYESDRFLIYRNNMCIELSGTDAIGNHEPLEPGEYMLTADDGYIHLSKPLKTIEEVKTLLSVLT